MKQPLAVTLSLSIASSFALASPPPHTGNDEYHCRTVMPCAEGARADLGCATPAAIDRCHALQHLGISDRVNRSHQPADSRFPAGVFIHNDGPAAGTPLEPQPGGKSCRYGARTSHCSAFARFAAREVFGLDLPPDPGRDPRGWCFLSNAQHDALRRGEGGFGAVVDHRGRPDPVHAQALANAGHLVLASVANPRGGAGHIAVVLPDTRRDAEALRQLGPEIIQAGAYNYAHTDTRTGFWGHIRGGRDLGKVEYFAAPPR